MKTFIFIIIFFVVSYFLYNYFTSKEEEFSKNIINKDTPTKIIQEKQKSLKCKTLNSKALSLVSNNETQVVWNNIHIKHIDGSIYRVRFFYDDGPNGSYKKTVLYKEDDSGFPKILKTFKGFSREPLKEYFSRGEVIWEESALSHPTDDIFWRNVNGKIVEASNSISGKCNY